MPTTAIDHKQLLINNEWRDAAGGRTMDVINPATEEVIATVGAAGQEDVDAAVTAARAAFEGPWGKMSARERGRLLSKLADRVMERADELAAPETPLTALALGEIAIEVGLPPGVLNVLTGPGADVGQALVAHPGIDKIAFTGGTNTGKAIMRSAADTLKRITLELGGKSPNIVLADADLAAARRGARA